MNTRTNRMKNSLLKLLSWLYPASLFDKMGYYATVFRSYKIASKLKACGRGTRFGEVEFLTGHRHISVGEDTVFLPHLFLTSWGADDDSTKISILAIIAPLVLIAISLLMRELPLVTMC